MDGRPGMTDTVETNASLMKRREAAVPASSFNAAPIFVARAEGSRVWDVEGKEYVDFAGGIGAMAVGHGHPRVLEAVRRQLDAVVHTSWHAAMYESYLRLAERLNEIVPAAGPLKSCFFNSGAEGIENAVKVSRAFTGRAGVVVFERGFHGRTLLTMTMTGKVRPYKAGFGPFAPEVYRLPYAPFFGRALAADAEIEKDCRDALDRLFAYHADAESLACVVVEPILGEGGFLPGRPAALRALRRVTRERGILIVADEVQSGFGRTGKLFATEHYDLDPDVVVTAKSLAAGFPLSGVTARAEILDTPMLGGLGSTYGGNAVSCAAACAVMEIVGDEDLPGRATGIGRKIQDVFEPLVSASEIVGDARGLGSMWGLEIVDPATRKADPDRARRAVVKCREKGLLIMTASGNVLRTLMPLNIGDEDLQKGLAIIEASVKEVS